MDGAGNVSGGIVLGRPEVEDERPRRLAARKLGGKRARRNQQLRVRVAFHLRNRPTGPAWLVTLTRDGIKRSVGVGEPRS